MPSPFYPASVVLLQFNGGHLEGMVSHIQLLATQSSTVNIKNTWILTMKPYKFLLLVLEAVK